MNHRERVHAVLRGEQPDRVPRMVNFYPWSFPQYPNREAGELFDCDIRFGRIDPPRQQTAFLNYLRTERGRLAIYAPDYVGHRGWLVPDIRTDRVGYRQHRHFLDMLTGDAPPDHSAHAGLVSLRVIEAGYRAAETGVCEAVEVDT
jgi:hypothetical protein